MRLRNKTRGITLIELMIVIVVVSILVAVSYPSYLEFVARAKRSEAREALLRAAVNQERWYLNATAFADDLTNIGFDNNPYTTPTGAYIVSLNTDPDGQNYTATATFQLGGGEAQKCLTFTIDGAGVRGSTPDTDCWERTR